MENQRCAPNPQSMKDLFSNQNMDEFFFNNENNNDDDDNDNINNIINGMNNLDIKKNSKRKILIPRKYQIEIFEKAKNQNSIIYVETGKGKTFISIMLMAHFLNIDITSEKKQKIDKKEKVIFFVCDTALISQQKNEISNILGIEVGTIQGKKDKKTKNDYEAFRHKWNSLNVFVAIPSIIYKLLSCGFLTIFEISMLVFDECHHTSDDHPYNKIMNEFYFFYKKEKKSEEWSFPKIYGLTASPMKTGVKGNSLELTAYEALQKLSENLDCVVVIDPEMINSNAKEMKPGESIQQYLQDDTYITVKNHTSINEYKKLFLDLYNECFYDLMWISFSDLTSKKTDFSTDDYLEKYIDYIKKKFKAENMKEYNTICQNFSDLYNLRKFSPFFVIFEKLQRHLFMLMENLCLDSIIEYFSTLIGNYNSLYQRKIENNNNYLNNSMSSILSSEENEEDDYDETDVLKLAPETIKEIKDIYSKIHKKLKQRKEKEYYYISDRLQQLYYKIDDLFKENYKSKFIIFIANRIVAHFLKPALSSYLTKNHIDKKCDEIIGINKKKSGGGTTLTPSITLKRMNEIITQFNEDKFDILIGTSAIEEGLDIQTCNAVLALVELNTPKSFIQIKGRARKTNSHFFIFTNSPIEAKLKVKEFISFGNKMKGLFDDGIIKDFRRPDYIYNKPTFFYYIDENSHSKITMGNVSMFFNEIKQQIEANGSFFKTKIDIRETKTNKGSQEYEYSATINVSTNLKKIQKLFPYTSPKKNTKDDANKMCFLYTLMNLKKYNYLDCHLKFCNSN
jgi:endoribonuclease Dicer